MAKINKKVVTNSKSNAKVEWDFPMTNKNLMIFGLGFLVIVVGYLLMSTGLSSEYATVEGAWNSPLAVSIAPLLLVIGYCVIIPYSILTYFPKNNNQTNNDN